VILLRLQQKTKPYIHSLNGVVLRPQSDKLQNAAGFGFDNRLHYQLATAIRGPSPDADYDSLGNQNNQHSKLKQSTLPSPCLGASVVK
jgi:hypothetical protein